jgi:predicted enzyme related to lactoylglutathione lyase
MDYNPVGRFEIYVSDMERAKHFYANVFQKGPWMDLSQEGMGMFAFPMTDDAKGAPGALVHMADHGPSEQGTIVYFSCEDCAVEEARVAENG